MSDDDIVCLDSSSDDETSMKKGMYSELIRVLTEHFRFCEIDRKIRQFSICEFNCNLILKKQ